MGEQRQAGGAGSAGWATDDPASALRRLRIVEGLDTEIERCRRGRLPLEAAIERLLPLACREIRAQGAILRALDERLEWRTFAWGTFLPGWAGAVPAERLDEAEAAREPDRVVPLVDASLIMRVLDCAGEVIGIVAFAFPPGLAAGEAEQRRGEVRVAGEMLDNYLEGIASAARKHRIELSATTSLQRAVLEDGADKAIATLSGELDLAFVFLIYGDLDVTGTGTLKYRYYEDGAPQADSVDRPSQRFDVLVRQGLEVLGPGDGAIRALFPGSRVFEQPLINGLNRAPIGRLVVSRRGEEGLDPEGRDILHIFSECLSQRLVDYNRERRVLSAAFPPAVVNRLLREREKYKRFLAPRVEEVAILFADLVSFTAICERVVRDASGIGELINRWSQGAVQTIFEHGGVFDKMVGDCVIGLFGPPFCENAIGDRVLAATRTAVALARFTETLGADLGLDARIRSAGIGRGFGVAAGINVGPTSVGFFGPNNHYTGFSSAMNAAARLQGLASHQEVLVSAPAIATLQDRLGAEGVKVRGPEAARVKNVREPLHYYRLLF